MDGAHHLHRALNQCERSTHWGLLVALTDVQVGNRCEPAALIYKHTHKLGKGPGRLLKRQRKDVVPYSAARKVDVSKLTRLNRLIVSFNAETASLETGRKVGESSSVNQLAQD